MLHYLLFSSSRKSKMLGAIDKDKPMGAKQKIVSLHNTEHSQ
jgi:hypothetical protein